jgi:hypothetical protein
MASVKVNLEASKLHVKKDFIGFSDIGESGVIDLVTAV